MKQNNICCWRPIARSYRSWNQGVEAACLTINPQNSLIEFFLLILATLSSACSVFSVPRLAQGHPVTPGKEPQSARHSARTYNREKKSMTDMSVKNPGTGQPLRGLASGKYILGSYWKNFDSKFISKEKTGAHTDFYLFAHLNGKESPGLKVCRRGQIFSRPLRVLKMQLKRKTFLLPCLRK